MTEAEAMKYVHRTTSGDGKERLYFRKAGHARRPLLSPWGSQALADEVAAILKAETAPKALPGTLAGAVRAYELDSADFKGLQDSTKVLYRAMMYELAEDFGALPVERFTAGYILDLRDIWSDRGHVAANHRLQVLKNVLWPSIVAADRGDPVRPRAAGTPPTQPEGAESDLARAGGDDRDRGSHRSAQVRPCPGGDPGALDRRAARRPGQAHAQGDAGRPHPLPVRQAQGAGRHRAGS
jgi:hypothetical protein